jgi:hypothetical protein
MKSLMRVAIGGVILMVVSSSAVGVLREDVSGLYDTGVDGIGATDLHYVLTSVPSGPSTAMGIDASGTVWASAPAGSNWIAPTIFGTASNRIADPEGDYVYELTFSVLDGVDPSEIVIAGQWAADNTATMSLNGGAAIASRTEPGHLTLEPFEVTGLVSGLNTLEFTVTNGAGGVWNPTGLLVTGLGHTPEPATVLLLGLGSLCLVRRRRGR